VWLDRNRAARRRAEVSEQTAIVVANIDRLCRERDVTFEQVAQRAGLTSTTLGNLRNKKTADPYLSTLLAICAGLDARPEEVIAGTQPLAPQPRRLPRCPDDGSARGRPRSAHRPRDVLSLSDITSREREVLELLDRGLSYAQITHRLDVKRTTVISHTRSLQTKLGVSTKQEFVGIMARLDTPSAT
jgi:DNA-binding CsgD family transcriptional regulator/DNA-binding Xre family transcriptional regulator